MSIQVIDSMSSCGMGKESNDRPVLTHCQVLGPDLIERMRDMGIIANIQPAFVPTDMQWASQRLLPAQLGYSYAWKTLLDQGIHVSGGSDAPVEHCSPFLGIHDAIHRRGRGAMSDEVFRPEECLSLNEALWIYTAGAAYAAKAEHILGAIRVGYAADFVVIDPKVFIQTALLKTYEPHMVIVGGQIVFQKENYSDIQYISQSIDSCHLQKNLDGPFVPGKNGNIHRQGNIWSCKCCQIGSVKLK